MSPKRFYTIAIVATAFLYSATNVRAYIHLRQRREIVLSGMRNYCANPAVNSPLLEPEVLQAAPQESEFERVTLTQAIAGHVYTLPAQH